MGQNVSQASRGSQDYTSFQRQEEHRWRRASTLIRNDTLPQHESDALLVANVRPQPIHSHGRNRLSRLLSPSLYRDNTPSTSRSALQRSRSTIQSMFRRDSQPERAGFQRRTSYMRASGSNGEEQDFYPPRLPSIDQSSIFDRDFLTRPDQMEVPTSSQSNRRPNARFSLRRPERLTNDRPFARFHSALRRRRSPQPASRRPAEDQAVLLSQLLSAAAAATAATLMGDDHQALNEARSLSVGTGIGDLGGSGEDGSFDGFLRALQSGRIASALRQTGETADGMDNSANGLNFFRIFRFASTTAEAEIIDPPAETRMIPIIIVGIRSITPNSTSGSSDDLPPFLDALTSLASPTQDAEELGTLGHGSIDSILRPPQNGTSFRHRRRASMGGFGISRSRINERYDDQRSPDRRQRPWSMASSLSEPRPPPATPASPSPELSRIPSRNSTPAHSRPASLIANSLRELAGESRRNSVLRELSGESRRNSVLHRSANSPLAIHTEETISVHSTHSSDNLLQSGAERWDSPHRRSDTVPNVHYPRFASGHPRRNGVVEPDHPPMSRPTTGAAEASESRNSDSRSWIIYVLGGSYPENHPILTTPSLFSDNPTYEDMMLLSTLLGPAKAPVATEEDVQNAGGIYNTVTAEAGEDAKLVQLVAVATEDTNTQTNPNRIALEAEHRCLVCLCDFETEEVLRRLGKCGHLFHKECIDHWLMQGRNSCPLCRGEGVEEKAKVEAANTPDTAVSAS